MKIKIRLILITLIGAFLFAYGCATPPPKVVTAPKPAPAPVVTPAPAPTPPAPEPVPEKKEPVKTTPEPVSPPVQVAEPKETVPAPVQTEKKAPRAVASLRLTEQARLLIESKQPDQAITILEKAVNIDVDNGQNYYLLAEAWLMKGNQKQAKEFNRIAGMYLKEDQSWAQKVQSQKERIEKAATK